jgi:hypothetical protein
MITWAERSPISGSVASSVVWARKTRVASSIPGIEWGDHVGEVVNVFQVQGAHQRVLGTKLPGARHGQIGDLAARSAARQLH